MIKGLLQKFRKPKRRTQAERMLTLRNAPVYYLPITKCGSTYLKNLFYYLDHENEHSAGPNIHSNPHDLQRAITGDEVEISQSPHAFVVLRDPVDRFISLYFDKIYGDGPRNFPETRDMLASEFGLDLSPDIGLSGHRANCHLLIDWLEQNLAHKTPQPVNHHWRRQSSRLQRAGTLKLTHLTLEGLNWQLPLFLSDVVPEISAAMYAVKSDNRTIKPFNRAELLDEELREKIETVYSYDKALHEQASHNWQPWLKYGSIEPDEETLQCFSAADGKLNYIVTPKVGCTYLRNLFYLIENGELYEQPRNIHMVGPSLKRFMSEIDLSNNTSFFVVRSPEERFVSLYFDKILGDEDRAFRWITKRLVLHRGFIPGPDLTIEQHRHNCLTLLAYIGRKLTADDPETINPHWKPQVAILGKAIRFGMQPLLLEDLDRQLLQIAAGRVEGLEQMMLAVSERNTSKKPFSTAEIMTPEIAERISALYGEDQSLYERVKIGWRDGGRPPIL